MAEAAPTAGETRLARDLPKLREHLTTKSDGFDEWAAITFYAEHSTRNEMDRASARLLRLLLVATVEGLNAERGHGREDRDSILLLSRLMGFVACTAVGSIVADPTYLRRIVRVMAEEFKHGGKLAADSITEADRG